MHSSFPSGIWGMYLRMSILLAPLLRLHLKRRIAKGKEESSRLQERRGYSDVIRPNGSLIWLHAVGLGEVMALRGFILLLAKYSPESYFLVTSSTKASAQVFKENLPPRTIHQYFPLDVPVYCERFLPIIVRSNKCILNTRFTRHFQSYLCLFTRIKVTC